MTRTSYRDSHFQIWKNRIEEHVQTQLNMDITLDDLPDECYRMWFDETHFTPKEIAERITHNFINMT